MIRNRILVVDDDESLRWVTQAQLQQSGYQVSAAADCNQALELVRQAPPDLVITDLKMPGMCGRDLLKRIQAKYRRHVAFARWIRFWLLTAALLASIGGVAAFLRWRG